MPQSLEEKLLFLLKESKKNISSKAQRPEQKANNLSSLSLPICHSHHILSFLRRNLTVPSTAGTAAFYHTNASGGGQAAGTGCDDRDSHTCGQRQGSTMSTCAAAGCTGRSGPHGGRPGGHPLACVRVRPGSVSAAARPGPARVLPHKRRGQGWHGRVERFDEDRRRAAIGCKMCKPT